MLISVEGLSSVVLLTESLLVPIRSRGNFLHACIPGQKYLRRKCQKCQQVKDFFQKDLHTTVWHAVGQTTAPNPSSQKAPFSNTKLNIWASITPNT